MTADQKQALDTADAVNKFNQKVTEEIWEEGVEMVEDITEKAIENYDIPYEEKSEEDWENEEEEWNE